MAVSAVEVVAAAVEPSLGKVDVGKSLLPWRDHFEAGAPLENTTTGSATSMYFLSSGAGDEFLEGPGEMLATNIGLANLLQLMLYVVVGALLGALVVLIAETVAGFRRKENFREASLGIGATSLTWGEACLGVYVSRLDDAWRVFSGKSPVHSDNMDDDMEACLGPSKVDRVWRAKMDRFATTSSRRVVFDLEQNQVCEYVPGTWGLRVISSRDPSAVQSEQAASTQKTMAAIAKFEDAAQKAAIVSTAAMQARCNNTPSVVKSILVKNSRRRRYSSEMSWRRHYTNSQRLHRKLWVEEYPCCEHENGGHEIV